MADPITLPEASTLYSGLTHVLAVIFGAFIQHRVSRRSKAADHAKAFASRLIALKLELARAIESPSRYSKASVCDHLFSSIEVEVNTYQYTLSWPQSTLVEVRWNELKRFYKARHRALFSTAVQLYGDGPKATDLKSALQGKIDALINVSKKSALTAVLLVVWWRINRKG